MLCHQYLSLIKKSDNCLGTVNSFVGNP